MSGKVKYLGSGFFMGYYHHPTRRLVTSCRSAKEARFRIRLWHSHLERGTDPWPYWNDCFPTEYTEKWKQERLEGKQ